MKVWRIASGSTDRQSTDMSDGDKGKSSLTASAGVKDNNVKIEVHISKKNTIAVDQRPNQPPADHPDPALKDFGHKNPQ